ncbi:hypothetical protein [Geothermobacter hydrogeniphilus]|uniref:Uncharacterized protein n=1 Tax=Geothermobacter hydrogeniphilus TaxID=1969733 RepID=A0A1X0XL98_9BACT|nr:hypothetical protein [Geothermobacter hydrogeniphilus]ORJ53669.1 hypothetical protein B5V00_16340 [Geothermobacter hydrogeniphilus]
MEAGLDDQVRQTIGRTEGHLVARAASFLLLADSRASFAIEGECPPRSRLERRGRAVVQQIVQDAFEGFSENSLPSN